MLLVVAGVIIFGVALAVLGYFVIFPFFFPAEEAPVAPTPPPAGGLPTPPGPSDINVPPSVSAPHQSLLKTPADVQAEATLSFVDGSSLQQTLLNEAANKPGNNLLKEILLSGAAGQLNFSDVFPALLPEFTKGELTNTFEEDFTTLLYYDANGAWPAWIAKVKSGGSVSGAKTLISRLETSSNLPNLYLSSPGTPSGNFRGGQVSGVATRYLPYSQPGASLNYAWVGDKLIVSASFNGLKSILVKL